LQSSPCFSGATIVLSKSIVHGILFNWKASVAGSTGGVAVVSTDVCAVVSSNGAALGSTGGDVVRRCVAAEINGAVVGRHVAADSRYCC
jgi:hypothetical protein